MFVFTTRSSDKNRTKNMDNQSKCYEHKPQKYYIRFGILIKPPPPQACPEMLQLIFFVGFQSSVIFLQQGRGSSNRGTNNITIRNIVAKYYIVFISIPMNVGTLTFLHILKDCVFTSNNEILESPSLISILTLRNKPSNPQQSINTSV